jgi:signal transduction histidine kinase
MLWGPTLGTVVLAAVVVSLAIRRSLRHVTGLSARIDSIDASSTGNRLQLQGVPDELRPPFVKLNDMLERFEESLARERQFNADVSHELRTPLAGLRSILEVATSRDRPASEYRTSLSDALQVVQQLERIVENLLLLARIGSGQMKSNPHEEIRLRELVDSCFAACESIARSRRVRFDNRIARELSADSDKVKLEIITANLLANAAEYTTEGGWIAVESDPARGLVLAVRDSGPTIPERQLARLFDPFFRMDSSRSGGGEHLGIGLTLVKALCDTLGYRVSAGNEADGTLQFTVARASDSHPWGLRPGGERHG